MLSYNAAFTAACNKSYAKKAGWLVELYNNDQATAPNPMLFATSWTKITSFNVVANIVSVSDIVSSVDPHDCSYSVSNCTVRFAEGIVSASPITTMTELMDLRNKEYKNRKLRLRRYVAGTGLTSLSDFTMEFDGVVLDYQYDKKSEQWVFEVVQRGELKHKQLPSEEVNVIDYPKAPPSSIGAPIPILYGDFSTDSVYHEPQTGVFNLAPSICTDRTNGTFTFASHECKQLNTNAIADYTEIAMFFDDLKTYGFGYKGKDAGGGADVECTSSVSGPTTITLPSSSGNLYHKIKYLWLQPELIGAVDTLAGDYTNILDKNYVSGLVMNTANKIFSLKFSGINSSLQFVKNASGAGSYANTIGIEFYLPTQTHGGVDPILRVYNIDHAAPNYQDLYTIPLSGGGTLHVSSGTVGSFNKRTSNDGIGSGGLTNITTYSVWEWEEVGRYEYAISFPAGFTGSMTLGYFTLYFKDLIVAGNSSPYQIIQSATHSGPPSNYIPNPNGYDFSDPLNPIPSDQQEYPRTVSSGRGFKSATSGIFAGIQGRMVGATIGGRAGNTLAPTDLNTKSGFIIESILRDELGFTNSDIDESSFDDVAESDWYDLAFSVNEFVQSKELIKNLSFASRSITCQTSDGQWKIFRFQDTVTAPSVAYTIEYHKIKFLDYWFSSPNLLCNDLVVNYGYDYAKGEYGVHTHSDDTVSQGDTYQGQNRIARKHIDNAYLRYNTDSRTNYGESFSAFYVAQWKDPHLIIEFETSHFEYFKFQELDVIAFYSVPDKFNQSNINPFGLWASSGGYITTPDAPRTKYFLITKVVRGLYKCTFTVFNLHNL